MLALIALGYSLLCVLLLNAGWDNRHVESWQRACVFGAGWLAPIALILCWGLVPNLLALACTAAFCALMFFGGLMNISPRWMKRFSYSLVLGFWVWSFGQLVWWIPQYAKWKQETPFVSMEPRVPEPKPGSIPWKSQSKNLQKNAQDYLYEEQREMYRRAKSIELLHTSTFSVINHVAGFRYMYSTLLHPLTEDILPESVKPFRQELDYGADGVDIASDKSYIKTDDVTDMNARSTADFANPAGFGWVKSRTEVAGFRPHRFSKWPDAPKRWDVKRIDLVSLLLNEEPVVYVSNDLPRMADVGKLATRELDTFEKDGLTAIRKGDPAALDLAADQLHHDFGIGFRFKGAAIGDQFVADLLGGSLRASIQAWMPRCQALMDMVVAASSFIYVAVADLIPQLQHRLTLRETLAQLSWLAVGLSVVVVATQLLHPH